MLEEQAESAYRDASKALQELNWLVMWEDYSQNYESLNDRRILAVVEARAIYSLINKIDGWEQRYKTDQEKWTTNTKLEALSRDFNGSMVKLVSSTTESLLKIAKITKTKAQTGLRYFGLD